MGKPVTGTWTIPTTPDVVVAKALLWGTGFPQTEVQASGNSVTWTHRFTPPGAIIGAVLLFPLGLLLLLIKQTDQMVMTAVPTPGGTLVQFSGKAERPLIHRMGELMATASAAVPQPAPGNLPAPPATR